MAKIVSRRNLLRAAGGVTLLAVMGGGASLLACRASAARTAALLPLSRLFVAIDDIHDIELVGRSVRAGTIDDGRLVSALLDHESLCSALAIECPASRRQAMGDAFRADFRQGRYRRAADWIVSEGECLTAGLWVSAFEGWISLS
jgi:hypothetical protein